MERTLWAIAAQQQQQETQAIERTAFFLGENKSGKSTLIQTFLMQSREEAPKTTVALEYTYARAPVGLSTKREVASIYELGGGRRLANLLPVVITPENIHNLVITISLDLSRPYNVLNSLLYWLQMVKEQVQQCFNLMEPRRVEKLQQRANRVWGNHSDGRVVQSLYVPLVIVGCKYDIFQNEESEKRKWMARTLRYFAHKNGAHLIYMSQNDSRLQGGVRQIFTHYLFGSSPRKLEQLDHSQGIQVTAGSDSFDKIGAPPGRGGAGLDDGWINSFNELFSRPNS